MGKTVTMVFLYDFIQVTPVMFNREKITEDYILEEPVSRSTKINLRKLLTYTRLSSMIILLTSPR